MIKGLGSTPVFPIDFFEHSTLMTEVEYGGNDLLQIYNTQHLKHRLNSTGLYVTSTRANGFTLEVINNDPNMVMTGELNNLILYVVAFYAKLADFLFSVVFSLKPFFFYLAAF